MNDIYTINKPQNNLEVVLQLPLSTLEIPIRVKNLLVQLKIETVVDARDYLENTKISIKGISDKSIEESSHIISEFIKKSQVLSIRELEDIKDKRTSLLFRDDPDLCKTIDSICYKVIDFIFHKGGIRNTDIINKRFALNGNKKYTLEEIGDFYDLTRERVRQVEAKIIKTIRNILLENDNKKLKSPESISKTFKHILEDIYDLGNIVSEKSIISILRDKYKYDCSDKCNLELLLEIIGFEKLTSTNNSPYLKIDSIFYRKNKITPKQITKIISSIGKVAKCPSSFTLFDLVIYLKRAKIKSISNTDIINILDSSTCIRNLGGETFQIELFCLANASDKAFRILIDSGKPLHYREITKRINIFEIPISGEPLNHRNITGQMVQDNRFTPIGKSGRWGLSEWESVQNISAKDLMINALHSKGEPMTPKEIHDEVIKTRKRIPLRSIKSYLSNHRDIFCRIDKGVYGLKVWNLKEYQYISPSSNKPSLDDAAKLLFKTNNSLRFAEAIRELMDITGLAQPTIRQNIRESEHFSFSKAPTGKGLIITCINPNFESLSEVNSKGTLRDKIHEEIRTVLYTHPNQAYLKGELYKIISEQVECIKPTFYSYLSEMKDISSYKNDGKVYSIFELDEPKENLDIETSQLVISEELSTNLNRALSKLNIEEIDIGLFELGRIFESELKQYLLAAKEKGLIQVSNNDLSSLVKMITCVVREGIISKGYYLHLLREERNARAHGEIPTENQRQNLMNKAPYLVEKFIEYIEFFNQKKTEI